MEMRPQQLVALIDVMELWLSQQPDEEKDDGEPRMRPPLAEHMAKAAAVVYDAGFEFGKLYDSLWDEFHS